MMTSKFNDASYLPDMWVFAVQWHFLSIFATDLHISFLHKL